MAYKEPKLAGDVTGDPTANTVAKIQGVVISGTPSTGQVLTATSSTAADWQTSGGGGSSDSTFIPVNQTAHGFTTGQAVYYNGTTWALAEANNADTLSFGVVSVVDANNFDLYIIGELTGLSGLVAGQYYYVSDATAGLLTTTEPTSSTSFSNPLMFAISTTVGIVLPYRPSGVIAFPSGPNIFSSNLTTDVNITSADPTFTNLGPSLSVSGTSFLVQAQAVGGANATNMTPRLQVTVDGSPQNYLTVYGVTAATSGGSATATVLATISGLSAGSHTFQLQGSYGGSTGWEVHASSNPTREGAWLVVTPIGGSGFGTDTGTLFSSTGNPATNVQNTTTETTFFTYTMPANTLPTNGEIYIRALFSLFNNDGTQTITYRLYLGGTVMLTWAPSNGVSASNVVAAEIECTIVAAGATNAQYFSGTFIQNSGGTFGSNASPYANAIMAHNTGTIDTTTSQVIKITAQLGAAAGANLYTNLYGAKVILV